MSLQEHYNLSAAQCSSLSKVGVQQIDLFRNIKFFDPHDSKAPISKINLLYYLDNQGDFQQPPLVSHKLIAKEIFETLTSKEKLEVLSYLDYINNGDEE